MNDAERRLDEHLELLRAQRPDADTALARRVVRTVRWQRAARAPLRVAGMIAAAALDGLAVLVGAGRSRG